jgi:hypothetical protein
MKNKVVILYKSNPINEKETIEIAKKIKDLKSKGVSNKEIVLVTLNDFSFKLDNITLDFTAISKIVNCLVKLYEQYKKNPNKFKTKLSKLDIVKYCEITNEQLREFKSLLNEPQFKILISNLIKSVLDLDTKDTLHIPTSLSYSELLPYIKNLSIPEIFEARSIISSSKTALKELSTNLIKATKLARKMVKGGGCPGGEYKPKIEIYKYKIPDWEEYASVPASERHFFRDIEAVSISKGIERLSSGPINPADNQVYSLDILNSPKKTGGDYDITKLYDIFINLPAFSQIEDFKTNKLTPESVIVFRRYLEEAIEFNKTFFGLTKPDGSLIDGIREETGFIYKFKVPENTKVIIVGDLHGSYHTFFRTLIRLHVARVIDLSTFSVNDGYMLVFLGDIVDRGAFGVEMLYILTGFLAFQNEILKMRIREGIDPKDFVPSILINRGNHETMEYQFNPADKYRVLIEMLTKGACVSELDASGKFSLGSCSILGDFFTSCPSAIILTNGDYKVWCCHGGLPRSGSLRKRIKDMEIGSIEVLTRGEAYDIRWSDVFSSRHFDYSFRDIRKIEFCDHLSKRKGGCSYLSQGVDSALVDMELDFVIRGHQDFPGNNVILFNGDDYKNNFMPIPSAPVGADKLRIFDMPKQILPHGLNLDYNTNILIGDNPYGIYQNTMPVAGNYYNGPIFKIDMTYIAEPFNSVLTTSTNTDIGRYLGSDNFIVLDLYNCDNIRDFTKNSINWPNDATINKDVYEILEEFSETFKAPTDGGKRKMKGGSEKLPPFKPVYPVMEDAIKLEPIKYIFTYLEYLSLNLPLPEDL